MDNRIRIFMLGWEFPPFISGGLGTACYGLTKAMDALGMPVIFVLPKANPLRFGSGKGVLKGNPYNFRNIEFHTIPSTLRPYTKSAAFGQESGFVGTSAGNPARKSGGSTEELHNPGQWADYGGDLASAVNLYARRCAEIAQAEDFDIIHAHDWMTYPAAMAVAKATGKPLVAQIHSTEFDRSGEHVNQMVYDIEREGMHAADKVITVSNFTRNIILSRYGVPAEKVEVVYNGVDYDGEECDSGSQKMPGGDDKIVLFLGRVTMQKGPEYFLHAAKRVLEKMDNVKFVMAGDGDMLYQSIELAARLGIGRKVFFTRFLRGADVDKAYRMADLYVMPSVSEPFGITPLEALRHNVPVLISRQSGISEVLDNALKVDFWDINQMADKIAAVLRRPELQNELRKNGGREIYKFRWEDSAARMNEIYEKTLSELARAG